MCRTELHFVRCIKPNNEQAQEDYDAALVLHQLRCCGITEVARIARAGYPTRYAHQQFAQRYSSLLGNRVPRKPSTCLLPCPGAAEVSVYSASPRHLRKLCANMLSILKHKEESMPMVYEAPTIWRPGDMCMCRPGRACAGYLQAASQQVWREARAVPGWAHQAVLQSRSTGPAGRCGHTH